MPQILKTGEEINDILKFQVGVPEGDDKGVKIIDGQLSVVDDELVVGKDSTIVGMKVLTTTDGVVFVDVTEIASSDSGSTFAAFGGGIPQVGAGFYIGSDEPLTGFKLKVASLVNPGTGSVTREYFNGVWSGFNSMSVNADDLNEEYADNIGTKVGSEQVRFNELGDQVQLIVNGDLKYWARFIVTAPLTSDGQNEQVKVRYHGAHEINLSSQSEFFGQGEYPKTITEGLGFLSNLVGSSPSSTNIPVSPNITIQGINNTLNNNAVDGKTGFITMPVGLDTSRGLLLELIYQPSNSAVGDFELQLASSQASVGAIVDGNLPEELDSLITNINNEQDVFKKASFLVDVQNLKSGDQLAISFKRDGTVGNTNDTFAGNIILVNFIAKGTFWRP